MHIHKIGWIWNVEGVQQKMGLRTCFPQYYIIKRQTQFSMRHALNELQISRCQKTLTLAWGNKMLKIIWIHWGTSSKMPSAGQNSCYFSVTHSNVSQAFLFSPCLLLRPVTRDVRSPFTHCFEGAEAFAAVGIPSLLPSNAENSMEQPKSAGDSSGESSQKQHEEWYLFLFLCP